ncbi:polysaccharide deacetylase family protein [Pseudonocardia sp. TRM90224]|uniref:polysaccharide deacetylase family protein n=1 Tax=Pseudonocardia sp. TRM90224 TaxID=2812678 RepID=UPI001E2E5AE9|nr:polysaccharide deacetylase family protein [Pseudonocardia sp. TRM90224]
MSRTDRLAALLNRSGLDRLARLSWRGLLVLNYHRIGTPSETDDPDLYSCTADDFDKHVTELAKRFEIVTAGSTQWQTGGPARRIAITLDDGYADQNVGAEILHRHGVPGTYFITTGFIDKPQHAWWDEIAWLTGTPVDLPASQWLPDGLAAAGLDPTRYRRKVNAAYKAKAGEKGEEFLAALAGWTDRPRLDQHVSADRWMTWDDVRTLAERGMEIGAHSVTHPVLATLTAQRQREEIEGSVRRLTEELRSPVDLFSYPVGARTSFDATTRALLTEMGVRRAFSFYGGVNGREHTDAMDVQRAGVFGDHTPDVVQAMSAVPGILCSPSRYA